MKKFVQHIVVFLTLGLLFVSLPAHSQWKKWRYNKLFDSYYKHELKYSVGPTLSYINGDLGVPNIGYGYGGSVELKFLPNVEVSTGIRYFSMSALDHNAERSLNYCGNYFHYNILGRYYFIFNKIRTNADRNSLPQRITAYMTTGISLMRYSANPSRYGYEYSTESMALSRTTANIPIGFGMSFRIGENTYIVPEALYYGTATDLIDGIISTTDVKDSYGLFNIRFEHDLHVLAGGIRKITQKWRIKRSFKEQNSETDSDEIQK